MRRITRSSTVKRFLTRPLTSVITPAIAAVALAVLLFAAGSAVRSQSNTITVVLAGQSMIRSDIRTTAPAEVAIIHNLLSGSTKADAAFTNLEGAIAEKGETISEGRGFLAPPEALDALQAFGFNVLALADNHAFDLKAKGIANTLHETDQRHITHAGTGNNVNEAAAPAYLKTSKGVIALVASSSGMVPAGGGATANTPGANELRIEAGGKQNEATEDLPGAPANTPNAQDAQRVLQNIREARQHADVVIVYQHNHVFGNLSFNALFTEGMPERLAPNDWLKKWTHQEIDAGADIVVMHGAPLLHGVEIYRGRPIFYDLGNFIYNVPPVLTYIDEPMAWESAVATVRFQSAPAKQAQSQSQKLTLRSVSLRPVVLNNIGEGQPDVHSEYTNNQFLDTRGLPAPATGARAGYILQRLATLSKPFGTTLEIKGDTAEIKLKPAT